jgi:hypothetical protein
LDKYPSSFDQDPVDQTRSLPKDLVWSPLAISRQKSPDNRKIKITRPYQIVSLSDQDRVEMYTQTDVHWQ